MIITDVFYRRGAEDAEVFLLVEVSIVIARSDSDVAISVSMAIDCRASLAMTFEVRAKSKNLCASAPLR